jgi:hypothetical protein
MDTALSDAPIPAHAPTATVSEPSSFAPTMSSSPASASPAAPTLFRFAAEGVDLEFSGSEEFVEKQVERFRSFLRSAIGSPEAAPVPQEAPAPAAAQNGGGIEEFFAHRPIREGRGAIQNRILLAIYYLENVQGRREVSGNDILWCFQKLGMETPKNLHNTLGNLKRKIGHLEEGTRRGLYHLSPDGKRFIESRFAPA